MLQRWHGSSSADLTTVGFDVTRNLAFRVPAVVHSILDGQGRVAAGSRVSLPGGSPWYIGGCDSHLRQLPSSGPLRSLRLRSVFVGHQTAAALQYTVVLPTGTT